MEKKISMLGATGSIGRNAIDVALSHPDEIKVAALAVRNSREQCEELTRELGAKP